MKIFRTFTVAVLSVLLLAVIIVPTAVSSVYAADNPICKCIVTGGVPTVGKWESGVSSLDDKGKTKWTAGGDACARCGADTSKQCNPITDACITGPFAIPTVGNLLTSLIRLFFFIAGLLSLIYILLGAFDWVRSEGKEEDVQGAQKKIMSAVVGLIVMVAVLTLVIIIEQVIFSGTVCLGVSCPLKLDDIRLVTPN